MSSKVRTRFAPSPTGYLHVGGARTALYSWLYAKATGGDFVLRVEDTDQARSTSESLEMVLSDLKWLGLNWNEGPGKEGQYGPYRQSERIAIYKEHADRLLTDNKAFHCFCSDETLEAKKEQAIKEGKNPHYDGTCRDLSEKEVEDRHAKGEKSVVRFKVDRTEDFLLKDLVRGDVRFPADMVGDFVILRSSGMPVYNFCCAVDDALMNITHVLRAEEHLNNTLRQVMIYDAFSYPLPQFGHLSIILGEDKKKLSKRHGATSVNEYKEKGYLPEALNNFLALLGWSSPKGDEVMSIKEITEQFGLDRFKAASAVFDEEKMQWMNATHLRSLETSDLWSRVAATLETEGLEVAKESTWQSPEWQEKALSLYKPRMETLNDAVAQFRFLSENQFTVTDKGRETLAWDSSKKVISRWSELLADCSDEFISTEQFADFQNKVKEDCEVKGKFLFMPIRTAVIGVPSGAELNELVPLIRRVDLIARAKKVLLECE